MRIVLIGILILALLVVILFRRKYNSRGFDRKGMHRNGTRFDDFGHDVRGYDRDGYDRQGYDQNGYDTEGYNRNGYNQVGKNRKGQYNRLFDVYCEEDGFYSIHRYPIGVTNHARQRMMERMLLQNPHDVEKRAYEAYCYGKSRRQVKKSSAILMEDIENRHDHSNVLIYRGYIYIFSKENVLITVYKNDRIPL